MAEKPKTERAENFHSLSKKRVALRDAIADAVRQGLPPEIVDPYRDDKDQTDAAAKKFPKFNKLSQAKFFLKGQRDQSEQVSAIDPEALTASIGETYTAFASDMDALRAIEGFQMRRIRESSSNPYVAQANEPHFANIRTERKKIEKRLQDLRAADPIAYRACELVSYRQGLFEGGHIARVPSTEGYYQEILKKLTDGKAVFLYGPTGTGKTTLAIDAAFNISGTSPEMVYCSPQMRESQLWGKTGIKSTGDKGAIETKIDYGPLARSIRDGTICIIDEFTAMPQDDQVMFKGLFGKKGGDKVTIPGFGELTLRTGFGLIFTSNLKSEQHSNRHAVLNEMAREFRSNQMKIMYATPAESFDIMLARVMGTEGTANFSWHDLNVTLPKLCEALEEIQIAYTGVLPDDIARRLGVLDASGKSGKLKKYVLTQGDVETYLGAWITAKRRDNGVSFVEFLQERLREALTFEEDVEADRILAAKIIASKGLIPELSSLDLRLPSGTVESLWPGKPSELIDESKKERRIGVMELADLDPFNIRKKPAAQAAQQFLTPEEEQTAPLGGKETKAKVDVTMFNTFLTDTFTRWYDKDASKATLSATGVRPAQIDYTARKPDVDASKFGEYTLNPDTQGLDFEKAKVFIPDLSSFKGEPPDEVMSYVVSTYGASHYIPGIEYWKWMIENPGKVPQTAGGLNLKDGNHYCCPGSVLRDEDGNWNVPCALWDGSGFNRSASWLKGTWGSYYRVVLFEK